MRHRRQRCHFLHHVADMAQSMILMIARHKQAQRYLVYTIIGLLISVALIVALI